MALLNKLVKSSYNENKIDRRLAELSYSAINGERQEAKSYAPEGVVMPGQIDRERPLEAITKEMIKEYQESQAGPGAVIGGVPYMYRQSGMEPPKVKAPIEYQKFESEVDKLTQDRRDNAMEIKELEKIIKRLTNTEKKILFEINTFGDTPERLQALMKNKTDMLSLTTELKDAKTDADAIRLEIDKRKQLIDDIKKHNAIAVQENYGKIKEYETALQEANRDRMIIQQQPYESDYDYYNRLKEVEKQRYNPLLYKQVSLNQNIVELKQKLPNLFKEEATIEEVIKSLSDDNKFLLNKHFGSVEKLFKGQYGYNPSMSVNDIANILTDITQQTNAATVLQGALKRPSIKEGYSQYLAYNRPADTIAGAWKAKKARQERNFVAVEKITTDLENQIKQVQQDIQREKRRRPGLSTVSEADEAGLQRELDRLAEIQRQNEAEISNTYDTQVAREVVGRDGKYHTVMVPAIVNRVTGAIQYKGDEEKEAAATLIKSIIRGRKGRKAFKFTRDEYPAIAAKRLEQVSTMEPLSSLVAPPSIPRSEKEPFLTPEEQKRISDKSKYEKLTEGLPVLSMFQPEPTTPTTPTTPAPLTREVSRLVPKSAAAKTILKAMRTKRIEKIKTGAIRAVQERAVKSYQKAKESSIQETFADIANEVAKEELQQAAAQAIAELNDERDAIIRETFADIANGIATEESKAAASQAIAEIDKQKKDAADEVARLDKEAKKLVAKIKREQKKIEKQKGVAASKIQGAYKGRLARKSVNVLRSELEQAKERIIQETLADIANGVATEESKEAATQAIAEIEAEKAATVETAKKQSAASKLQSVYKGRLARKYVNVLRPELKQAKERIIQETLADIANGIATEESKQAATQAIAEIDKQRNAAAARMQGLYRGSRARKSVAVLRSDIIAAQNIARFKQQADEQKRLADEQAAIKRQEMYDAAYNAAIAGGASAAGAAAIAAKAAGGVIGTVASTTAGLAGSALTGLGRQFGFFKTPEEIEASKQETARRKEAARQEAARKKEIAKQEATRRREAERLAKEEAARQKEEASKEREAGLAKIAEMRARMEKRNESFEQALIANAEAQARDEAAAAAAAARAAKPRTPPPLSREVSGFSTLSAATTVRLPSPPLEEAMREALKAQRARRQELDAQLEAARKFGFKERSPSPLSFNTIVGIVEYGAKDFNKMSSTEIKDVRDRLQKYVDKSKSTVSKNQTQLNNQDEAVKALAKAERAYEKSKKEGRGLGLVRARKHKISPEEAMKNRLRLVVSQVQAGNTNPKLMIEVNRLYKKLYKIDNAYSLIKK